MTSHSPNRRGAPRAAPDSLRRLHLARVLRHVHVNGPTSRAELAAATGMNRSTIGDLVGELVARGLVLETEPRMTGAPGRPSPIVEPRLDGVAAIAMEVSVDSLAAAVIGIGGTVLAEARVGRRREPAPPGVIVARLADLLQPLLAEAPVGRIVACGIAVAGLVRDAGSVAVAPNLGWRDVPLASLMREALELDVPVLVGNDADLAALAEHTRGAGVGTDDFIFLWGEVGVGAGIIVGGQPLRGRHGFAGEVGHMPIDPNGVRCRCGSRGCWETFVAEDALLRSLGRAGSPEPRRELAEVLSAAGRGDPSVSEAIARVGEYLGFGLASLVNTLDPDRIALGGLFGSLHPYVAPVIERELDRWAMPGSRVGVEVVVARLGGDAPVLGAGELALAGTLDDPTSVFLKGGPPAARSMPARGGERQPHRA